MPAVGYALLCLLLAMLFSCLLLAMLFSCLLLAMLFSLPTLQIGLRVSFAPVACCHATALLFVSFVCIFGRSSRLQCQLFVPVVPLVILFSLRVSSALVFCLPEFDPLGSVVRPSHGRPSPSCYAGPRRLHTASALGNLTLPPFYFSTTGSSGCGSFSVLLTSPSASGVLLGRHFMVVYYGVIVGLVPPTPLLGAAPLRDQRHYSVLRHFVIIGSR